MKNEREKHFDPQLLDLFIENFDKMIAVQEKYTTKKDIGE